MGLKISTDDKGLKIWRDDKGGFPRYSYAISKKNDDGTYTNCYQDIRFPKGNDFDNGAVIHIKNAFMSFNVGKDGKKYPYLMVTDFERTEAINIDIPDSIDDDSVPFK